MPGDSQAVAPAADAYQKLDLQLTDGQALQHLTDPSITHLKNRLSDFSGQVLREARLIEKAEHVGSGPPEITAAHIDEAWWVSRRRIRRSKHPILNALARLTEVCGVAGFGIGASNLTAKSWGPTLFIISAIATIVAFLGEGYLARNE
jgi:hypothetical protein